MNEKIKKTFRAITSAVLAGAFVVSSVIGGGADSFVSSSVVFAEDDDVEISTLAEGTYSAKLIKKMAPTNNNDKTNYSQHFYGEAILKVDEDGNQKITIGVENWSLYDAFIPRKQEYAKESTLYFPSKILNEDNYSLLTKSEWYANTFPQRISDSVNDWFDYGDTKFGNIDVDVNESLDVAYVTFDIEDYQKNIVVYTWTNVSTMQATEVVASYQSPIVWKLDTSTVRKIDNMAEATDEIKWGNVIRLATPRADTTGLMAERYYAYFIEPNMMHGYSCMPVFPESKRAYWETISLIDAL